MSRNNGFPRNRQELLMMRAPPAPPDFKMGPGKVVRYRQSDAGPNYLTNSPTASKFVSLLRRVDNGDVGDMVVLLEEMRGKDAHLQGVASTRENAITALEWDIVPPIVHADRQRVANEAADFAREELTNLSTFPATLVHLTEALSVGVAATELIWKDFRLVETNDVYGGRLTQDMSNGRLKVITDKKLLGAEMPRGKFVVYIPKPRAGFPFRVTLTRAAAWLYLVKHFVFADWAGFCERFGMPIPVGTLGDNVEEGAKADLETALDNLMAQGYMVLPEGCGVELKEVARGTHPYGELLALVDKKFSILWLGQTLTTEMPAIGSFAAANVHNNVRTDILLSDIRQEAEIVQKDIITPMCQLRFPNVEVPYPVFRRKLYEGRDIDSERLDLDQLRFAKELGLTVDEEIIYEKLRLPKPSDPSKAVRLGSDIEESEDSSNSSFGGSNDDSVASSDHPSFASTALQPTV